MSLYKSPAEFEALIQDLRRQLVEAQRGVTHGSGAPTAGITEPYVDDAGSRLYFTVAGVWKSVALT